MVLSRSMLAIYHKPAAMGEIAGRYCNARNDQRWHPACLRTLTPIKIGLG